MYYRPLLVPSKPNPTAVGPVGGALGRTVPRDEAQRAMSAVRAAGMLALLTKAGASKACTALGEALPDLIDGKDVRTFVAAAVPPRDTKVFMNADVAKLRRAIAFARAGLSGLQLSRALNLPALDPATLAEDVYRAVRKLGGTLHDADVAAGKSVARMYSKLDKALGHAGWYLAEAARSKGHSAVPRSALVDALRHGFGDGAVDQLVARGDLVASGQLVTTPRAWARAGAIAAAAARQAPALALRDETALDSLTPEQRDAARSLLRSEAFLTVLTGPPGAGKTTVIKALLAGGLDATVLAPVARACGDGYPRLPIQDVAAVSTAAIIVDDASMLCEILMDKVMKMDPVRLVLVGDPDTGLPPIRAGAVLRDLAAAPGVHAIALPPGTARHSAFVDCLRNSGVVPDPLPEGVRVAESTADVEAVAAGLAARLDAHVLTARNEARVAVNRAVQLLRAGTAARGTLTRWLCAEAGTPVAVDAPSDGGRVRLVLPNSTVVHVGLADAVASVRLDPPFLDGDRVIVTRVDGASAVRCGDTGTWAGDVARMDSGAECDGLDLDLAYATTVHRFQGSEAEHVVIPVSYAWDRELLCAAASRARSAITFVGSGAALRQAAARTRERRFTSLSCLL